MCSVCKKRGASIGCIVENCLKKFHFPCTRDTNEKGLLEYVDSWLSIAK